MVNSYFFNKLNESKVKIGEDEYDKSALMELHNKVMKKHSLKCTFDEFLMGLKDEGKEHTDVGINIVKNKNGKDDIRTIAKIASAHLKADKKYYTKLSKSGIQEEE